MRRTLIAAGLVMALASLVHAQGGLEVRVVSARVVPNPKPEWAHDYKAPNVLQVEVVGTDRSGARQIESRADAIALYNADGAIAARFLYPVDDWTHYYYGAEARTEVHSKLIFSVPKSAKEQYLLKWAVARYSKMVNSFTWTSADRPLTLPLREERGGVTVSVDKAELGHPSKEEIESAGLAPEKAMKMAADHLILTLTFSGLLEDRARMIQLESLDLYTVESDDPNGAERPRLDYSRTEYDAGSFAANPQPGSLLKVTERTTCHFLGTSKMPEITKLTISVSRRIPFDEGWAPVAFDGQ